MLDSCIAQYTVDKIWITMAKLQYSSNSWIIQNLKLHIVPYCVSNSHLLNNIQMFLRATEIFPNFKYTKCFLLTCIDPVLVFCGLRYSIHKDSECFPYCFLTDCNCKIYLLQRENFTKRELLDCAFSGNACIVNVNFKYYLNHSFAVHLYC